MARFNRYRKRRFGCNKRRHSRECTGDEMLELEKDGKGNFRVKASPKWTQGANGKYDSKVAQFVYNILKKAIQTQANQSKMARQISK